MVHMRSGMNIKSSRPYTDGMWAAWPSTMRIWCSLSGLCHLSAVREKNEHVDRKQPELSVVLASEQLQISALARLSFLKKSATCIHNPVLCICGRSYVCTPQKLEKLSGLRSSFWLRGPANKSKPVSRTWAASALTLNWDKSNRSVPRFSPVNDEWLHNGQK